MSRKYPFLLLFLVILTHISPHTYARELRTPLDAIYAPIHYPYPLDHHERTWDFQVQAVGYQRTALNAFTHKDSTETTNYAALYFGKEDFMGQDAFQNAMVNIPTNPWLSLAKMSPRVIYNEHGVVFELNIDERFCDDTWCIGVRARLPFRAISVERFKGCGQLSEELGYENSEEFIAEKCELFTSLNGATQATLTFAYRLDFLSRLNFTSTLPFVNYADPNFSNHVTMACQDVTNQTTLTPPIITTGFPLFVIKRDDGSVPTGNFGQLKDFITLDGLNMLPTSLNPDGSGLANNQRGFFDRTKIYTPLSNNSAAQSTLWLTPGIEQQANSINIPSQAETIRTSVNDLLRQTDDSAEDFFARHGICFTNYHKIGVGDLNTEFFVFYQINCTMWAEGLIGLIIPTAQKLHNANKVFAQPLGNNGHTEIRLGGQYGWDAMSWLNIKADLFYSWALKAHEKIAAPFKGATIKNIGPTINAQVSWGYLFGHIDLTLINRSHHPLGCDVGYEFYAKRKDNISLNASSANDLLGIKQPLDAQILTKNTNAVVHKIHAEIFFQREMFELFAGFTHAIAGKNAPKETDLYLGLTISF